jgi:ribonuclease Z
MSDPSGALPVPAYLGGLEPMTRTPVVGQPAQGRAAVFVPGAVTATQDLTVFNVTKDAITARQAKVNDAPPPVHGPSQTSPALEPQPAPPAWWTGALLDL